MVGIMKSKKKWIIIGTILIVFVIIIILIAIMGKDEEPSSQLSESSSFETLENDTVINSDVNETSEENMESNSEVAPDNSSDQMNAENTLEEIITSEDIITPSPLPSNTESTSEPILSEQGKIIKWKDEAIEFAVRDHIDKMKGDIYTKDVEKISSIIIDCPKSLEDLNYLSSLELINIAVTNIDDLDFQVISSLPLLTSITLYKCNINDFGSFLPLKILDH